MASGWFLGRDLFEENMALRCEVKALTYKVETFKSGEFRIRKHMRLAAVKASTTLGYLRLPLVYQFWHFWFCYLVL